MKNHWLFLAITRCSSVVLLPEQPQIIKFPRPLKLAEAETRGDIPRTPSGKPDFNGIWQVMMNANDNLEPAAPKAAYQLVPGDFVPVPHPDIVAMGAVSASTGKLRGC